MKIPSKLSQAEIDVYDSLPNRKKKTIINDTLKDLYQEYEETGKVSSHSKRDSMRNFFINDENIEKLNYLSNELNIDKKDLIRICLEKISNK